MSADKNEASSLHQFLCTCGTELNIATLYVGRMTFCPRCSAPIIVPSDVGETARGIEPRLEHGDISLRPAHHRDWEALFPIRSDPQNYLFELAAPETSKQLKRTLKEATFPKRFAKTRLLRFVIGRWGGPEDGTVIGTISLSLSEDHLTADVGIMIHHPYQGQGFGRAALRGLMTLAFNEMGLHRLSGACDANNAACVALFTGAGFEEEGRVRKQFYHRQRGWIDHCLFGLLDQEWRDLNRSVGSPL